MFINEKKKWIEDCLADGIRVWFYTTGYDRWIYISTVDFDEDGELIANGYYPITDVYLYGHDPDPYSVNHYPMWCDKEYTVATTPIYINPLKETLR